jgi:single-strand DNA-binding protein
MGSKKGMNVVMAVGNLGKDSDLKYGQNGKPILTFSIAATTGFGDFEHTEWFNCVMFGERTEKVAQFLKKGQMVGITGQLQTRSWEDNEGKKHYRTEVKVNDLTLLGNGNGQGGGNGGQSGSNDDELPAGEGEEIPF